MFRYVRTIRIWYTNIYHSDTIATMDAFKVNWPELALFISLAFNLWQSGNSRKNTKDEKETEAINDLKREMAKVNTVLGTINSDLDGVKKDIKESKSITSDFGAFKERVDNTRANLIDLKTQVGKMIDMVQTLLTAHTK